MLKDNLIGVKFTLAFVSTLLVLIPLFGQKDIPTLVKEIKPGLVAVYTFDETDDTLYQASGFFFNADGDVVTCHHVIFDAYRTEVQTVDRKFYKVKYIKGSDEDYDLAILSLKDIETPVYFLNINTDLPAQGERILAFGYLIDLEFMVTDGIASAVYDDPEYLGEIQVTAPTPEGFSGGHLVNLRGDVIGVSSYILLDEDHINFATTSSLILELKTILSPFRSCRRKSIK